MCDRHTRTHIHSDTHRHTDIHTQNTNTHTYTHAGAADAKTFRTHVDTPTDAQLQTATQTCEREHVQTHRQRQGRTDTHTDRQTGRHACNIHIHPLGIHMGALSAYRSVAFPLANKSCWYFFIAAHCSGRRKWPHSPLTRTGRRGVLDGGRDGDRDGDGILGLQLLQGKPVRIDPRAHTLRMIRLKLRHILVFLRHQTQPRLVPIMILPPFRSRFID